ncbi:MAG TPA: choice-of-anchor D domain-containing protein, partial [Candidatus Angelobacter sp.]|nr:choice-of-anchor D domain-containing protein [Candidatus Angelobacter sp.]
VGLTTLTFSFTITGNQPGDYTFQSFCPASLAPGSSCTINVTFTPKASGNRDAKLSLTDNDENNEFVPLTGSGH